MNKNVREWYTISKMLCVPAVYVDVCMPVWTIGMLNSLQSFTRWGLFTPVGWIQIKIYKSSYETLILCAWHVGIFYKWEK